MLVVEQTKAWLRLEVKRRWRETSEAHLPDRVVTLIPNVEHRAKEPHGILSAKPCIAANAIN